MHQTLSLVNGEAIESTVPTAAVPGLSKPTTVWAGKSFHQVITLWDNYSVSSSERNLVPWNRDQGTDHMTCFAAALVT